MTEKEIARKLLERWVPDCPIDDVRQPLLDAWNGNRLAAQYVALVLFDRLADCAQERERQAEQEERRAERQAEFDAHRSLWG